MADAFPGIPAISQRIDRETATVLRPVVEILRQFVDGNLPQKGIIAGLQRLGVSDGNGNFQIPPGAIAYDNTPPPAPTGLEAMGAIANIILSWDAPPEEVAHRVAYTEVWRSETDNLSSAQMIGQARGQVFVDAIGSAAVRYYWVRFAAPSMTVPPITGPYNAQAGTRAETSTDPGMLIDLLVKAGNNTFLYKQEDPNLVIDGVPIPVGVYMNAAFIRKLSVTNAMIANAAIDNAKIANLDAGKITTGILSADRIDVDTLKARFGQFDAASIGDASIGWIKLYGDMYSDNWHSSGGTQGWYIARNGNAWFNNVNVRGNIYADNLYGNVVGTGNIIDGAVTDGIGTSGSPSAAVTIQATGARVLIMASASSVAGSGGGEGGSEGSAGLLQVYRNGTLLKQAGIPMAFINGQQTYSEGNTFVLDYPPAGPTTYTASSTAGGGSFQIYVEQIKK